MPSSIICWPNAALPHCRPCLPPLASRTTGPPCWTSWPSRDPGCAPPSRAVIAIARALPAVEYVPRYSTAGGGLFPVLPARLVLSVRLIGLLLHLSPRLRVCNAYATPSLPKYRRFTFASWFNCFIQIGGAFYEQKSMVGNNRSPGI